MNRTKQYLSIYAIAALLTFGWISADPCPESVGIEKCGPIGDGVFIGFYAGMAWPLYVIYKIFKQVRQ